MCHVTYFVPFPPMVFIAYLLLLKLRILRKMSTLEQFLLSRDISEETVTFFKNEKIDCAAFLAMTEEDIRKLLPKYGDRIAIRNFCERNTVSVDRHGLLERLRLKLASKGKQKDLESMPPKLQRKSSRWIEIGWISMNNVEKKTFRQVRINNGGGTRRISVPKSFTCSDVLNKAKELFFPNGISSKGSLDLFETALLDFKRMKFEDMNLTVQDIYDTSGLSNVRFYLSTSFKRDMFQNESDEDCIPHTVVSGADTDLASSSKMDNASTVIDLVEETKLAEYFDTSYETSAQMYPNDSPNNYSAGWSAEMHIQAKEVSSQHVDLLPILEDIAGPMENCSNFLLNNGEYELTQLPQLSVDAKHTHIYIDRQNCVTDLLKLYEDESVVHTTISVEFIGEPGSDTGGLTKEVFSLFWNKVETDYFIGEDVIIPFLPLHRKKECYIFKIIGRILSHSILLTKTLPLKMSRCVYLALGKNNIIEDILIEDFLLHLTYIERSIIKKGLKDITTLSYTELDTLTSIFSAYNYFAIPKQHQFRDQIIDIASEVLIERPKKLINIMKEGFTKDLLYFWENCNESNLTYILAHQKPTTKKILNCLKTVAHLKNEESKVLHFFRLLIQEMDSDTLLRLLFFITGSYMMPSEINIEFNSTSGPLRRPITHTCSNTIELSYFYSSYQEFRREINLYLGSEFSYHYSQL